jgi:hypothetical protein
VEATNKAAGILAGVDPETPAYAAGMRDGMRLIRREAGALNDSSVEIAYRVKDGDGERVIRYMPRGKTQVKLQRVLPVQDMAAQGCEARMRAM